MYKPTLHCYFWLSALSFLLKQKSFRFTQWVLTAGALHSFMWIQISIWYHLSSPRRISFKFSYSGGFLVIKSSWFCLPSFLRDTFISFRIQVGIIFFLRYLKMLFHCLLVWMVPSLKWTVILIFISLCLCVFFFSDCFKDVLFITGLEQIDYTIPWWHFLCGIVFLCLNFLEILWSVGM